MTSAPAFKVPDWSKRTDGAAFIKRTVDYDLALDQVMQALKDVILDQSLTLLTERLDCGRGALSVSADALDQAVADLASMTVPDSRAHVHWHLQQATNELIAASNSLGAKADLQRLERVWRNLSVASSETGHALVDLSQCCCGLSSTPKSLEHPHGI